MLGLRNPGAVGGAEQRQDRVRRGCSQAPSGVCVGQTAEVRRGRGPVGGEKIGLTRVVVGRWGEGVPFQFL